MNQQLLIAKFQEIQNEPFNWASHNCGLCTANLVLAYSGKDYVKELRKYSTSGLAATRLIKKLGGFEKIMEGFGLDEIPIRQAHRGDVVLHRWAPKNRTREALGGVIDHRATFAGENELVMIDTLHCLKAWRVR